MIVGLLLLHGAIMQASEMEFYQAIEPSLQSARGLLTKSSLISAELEPILEGLIVYVKDGIITKEAAINRLQAIKNALVAYKNRQYSNPWLSWFVSTPEIVKNKIQPAIDKVDAAIVLLNGNAWTPLQIAGVTAGAVAGAAVVAGGTAATVLGIREHNKVLAQKQRLAQILSLEDEVEVARGAREAEEKKLAQLRLLADEVEVARAREAAAQRLAVVLEQPTRDYLGHALESLIDEKVFYGMPLFNRAKYLKDLIRRGKDSEDPQSRARIEKSYQALEDFISLLRKRENPTQQQLQEFVNEDLENHEQRFVRRIVVKKLCPGFQYKY